MRIIYPVWVPNHAVLEAVLYALLNPVMVPADFDPETDTPDDRWRLGVYTDGAWTMNRDVRLSYVGNAGVIYPRLLEPIEQEDGTIKRYGDTPIPGLHVDLWAIGKPLATALRVATSSEEPLAMYDRTNIRDLLGELVDVPATSGVAEGIVGSSGMKMLNDRTIATPRLLHQ